MGEGWEREKGRGGSGRDERRGEREAKGGGGGGDMRGEKAGRGREGIIQKLCSNEISQTLQ